MPRTDLANLSGFVAIRSRYERTCSCEWSRNFLLWAMCVRRRHANNGRFSSAGRSPSADVFAYQSAPRRPTTAAPACGERHAGRVPFVTASVSLHAVSNWRRRLAVKCRSHPADKYRSLTPCRQTSIAGGGVRGFDTSAEFAALVHGACGPTDINCLCERGQILWGSWIYPLGCGCSMRRHLSARRRRQSDATRRRNLVLTKNPLPS